MKLIILLITLSLFSCGDSYKENLNTGNKTFNQNDLIKAQADSSTPKDIINSNTSSSSVFVSINGSASYLLFLKNDIHDINVEGVYFGETHHDELKNILSNHMVVTGVIDENIISYKHDYLKSSFNSTSYNMDVDMFLNGKYVLIEFLRDEFPGPGKKDNITVNFSFIGFDGHIFEKQKEVENF